MEPKRPETRGDGRPLAVLVTVGPASAYDPEAAFAKGTTVFGLQFGAVWPTTSKVSGRSATSRS